MQFLVQAATNFVLWLVNVVPSYQVMLRIKIGILFWLVHIQRNKLMRKALNEKYFCVRMHTLCIQPKYGQTFPEKELIISNFGVLSSIYHV